MDRRDDPFLTAALALDEWMRARDYAGYDPFDILNSPIARALSFELRWPAVAWTQLGKRLPARARPLLGVPAVRNAKGIGLVLAAYARLAGATAGSPYRERAAGLVEWLDESASTAHAGAGWGYPFPWANRAFYAPAGTPASVPTAFVAHALLDAADGLGLASADALAARAGDFLREALNRIPGADGAFCFSYTPLDRRAVHNANVLAASVLARLAARSGDRSLRTDALDAARFTSAAQRADGSWPYGTAHRDRWVDSFHTSYTVVALHEIGAAGGTAEFATAVRRGADYWRRAFLRGPAVGLAPGATHPIDTHAVAHAILTLLTLPPATWRADDGFDARAEAERLAEWCLAEMRAGEGFFHYREHRFRTERGPYMRWTQAWMLRALAELVADRAGVEADAARGGAEPDERGGTVPRGTPGADDTTN